MSKEDEQRETQMQMQMLEQQMNALQQQLQSVDEKIGTAQELKKSMEEFKDLKVGDEILIPISNGIFAEAKLLNNKILKINVGSGIVADKTVDQTQEIIERQIIDLKKIREQSSLEFDKMVKQAEELTGSIEQ